MDGLEGAKAAVAGEQFLRLIKGNAPWRDKTRLDEIAAHPLVDTITDGLNADKSLEHSLSMDA